MKRKRWFMMAFVAALLATGCQGLMPASDQEQTTMSTPEELQDPDPVVDTNQHPTVPVLIETKLRKNTGYGHYDVIQSLAQHNGSVYLYAFKGNPDDSEVWTGHQLQNNSGRIVWEDHWIRTLHIRNGTRTELATANVTENGLEWSNHSFESVSPNQAAREAANISVEMSNSTENFEDVEVNVSGVPDGGLVLWDAWGADSREAWQFYITEAESHHHLHSGGFVHLYYERGNQRVKLGVYDPDDLTENSSDWRVDR